MKRRLRMILAAIAVGVVAGTVAVQPPAFAGPPPGSCPYRYLCVFKDSYYSGDRLIFSNCVNVNLFWSHRSMWLEISSLVNNQTIGTASGFWENSTMTGPVLWETAYGYRDNLVVDGWNDRIGFISVC